MKDDLTNLILFLENELPPLERQQLEARLQKEPELQAELSRLKKAADIVEKSVPEMPEKEYWNTFYTRLKDKLPETKQDNVVEINKWFVPSQRVKILAALGSVAAVLVVASLILSNLIGIGDKDIIKQETQITLKRTEGVLEYVMNDHLEQTRMLLQDIVNAPDSDEEITELLSATRVRGRQLLSNNRTYRLAADKENDKKLIQLLDDLELVLIEVANLNSESLEYSLPTVRRIIRKKNLLIKIEIINLDETNSEMKDEESKVA